MVHKQNENIWTGQLEAFGSDQISSPLALWWHPARCTHPPAWRMGDNWIWTTAKFVLKPCKRERSKWKTSEQTHTHQDQCHWYSISHLSGISNGTTSISLYSCVKKGNNCLQSKWLDIHCLLWLYDISPSRLIGGFGDEVVCGWPVPTEKSRWILFLHHLHSMHKKRQTNWKGTKEALHVGNAANFRHIIKTRQRKPPLKLWSDLLFVPCAVKRGKIILMSLISCVASDLARVLFLSRCMMKAATVKYSVSLSGSRIFFVAMYNSTSQSFTS